MPPISSKTSTTKHVRFVCMCGGSVPDQVYILVKIYVSGGGGGGVVGEVRTMEGA